MLDVHPPHEAAHRWTDFFIHIATIVVGLLIAIGLEQTVEAIHHRHQAHELERNMLAESRQNIRTIDADLESDAVANRWGADVIAAARNAPEKDGSVSFTIPPQPPLPKDSELVMEPSNGVWTFARAEGTISLLPPDRAQLYERVDYEATAALGVEAELRKEYAKVHAVLRSMGVAMLPGETVHITPQQRDQMVMEMSNALELNETHDLYLASWEGSCQAVLDPKVTTLAQMMTMQQDVQAKLPQP